MFKTFDIYEGDAGFNDAEYTLIPLIPSSLPKSSLDDERINLRITGGIEDLDIVLK